MIISQNVKIEHRPFMGIKSNPNMETCSTINSIPCYIPIIIFSMLVMMNIPFTINAIFQSIPYYYNISHFGIKYFLDMNHPIIKIFLVRYVCQVTNYTYRKYVVICDMQYFHYCLSRLLHMYFITIR